MWIYKLFKRIKGWKLSFIYFSQSNICFANFIYLFQRKCRLTRFVTWIFFGILVYANNLWQVYAFLVHVWLYTVGVVYNKKIMGNYLWVNITSSSPKTFTGSRIYVGSCRVSRIGRSKHFLDILISFNFQPYNQNLQLRLYMEEYFLDSTMLNLIDKNLR